MLRRPNPEPTKSLQCCHGRLLNVESRGVQVNCFVNQSLRWCGHYSAVVHQAAVGIKAVDAGLWVFLTTLHNLQSIVHPALLKPLMLRFVRVTGGRGGAAG